MDKKQLRQTLLAARSALTAEERSAADAAIWRRLTELPELRAAKSILLYLDFRGEIESQPLIEWGLAQGKAVLAPVTVVAERRLIPVRITSMDDLQTGAYGIREPILREDGEGGEGAVYAPEDIDVVVLPGVGFDRQGGRLGYGGGYYDRFLPRLRQQTFKVAVAYEMQVLPEVPMEPHDTVLDALVTEKGVWRADH
jgi:5-formyltetrahydrofolate cyclo-ligase